MGCLDKYSDEELIQIFGSDIKEEILSRGYEYGWHKKVQYAGEIYVLVNPAFPSLVKIGYADDVQKRVKSLNSSSGVPDPFHIYATYKVKKRLEDLKLHKLIDSLDSDLRHTKNKEFYEMTPEKAYAILSAIAEINGDEDLLVLNPDHDEYFVNKPFSTSNTNNTTQTTRYDSVPDGIYHMNRKVKRWGNKVVTATVKKYGSDWIVLPGSMIVPLDGAMPYMQERWKEIREKVTIVDNILQEEISFKTPSAASDFCLAISSDGWWEWCDETGKRIYSYRNNHNT